MKRTLSFTLLLATTVLIACNSSSSDKTSEPEKSEITLVVASADAVEKFQCPMKCQGDTAYTTTGSCPVCKMDLEKVEANTEQHQHDSTEISY